MRVLLISPPVSSGWRPYTIPPVGLCYLKASAENSLPDVSVKVLDASGLSIRTIMSSIKAYKPDVVGVTIFTEARLKALEVLRTAKDLGCFTIAGGVHASALPVQLMDNYTYIDMVVIGEGEEAFVEVLKQLQESSSFDNISGIVYRSIEDIKKTSDRPRITSLDSLPLPDYSDLDLNKYEAGPIIGSRGCPFSCIYCASRNMWGSYRTMSVNSVVEEVSSMVRSFDISNISIMDDIFSASSSRVETFCRKILEEGLNIKWKVQTRVDAVSLPLLKLMKEAGCWMCVYGVESGAPSILKNLNKKEDIEDIEKAFSLTHEAGIQSTFNIIVGSPGETKETLAETRRLMRKCNPTCISTAVLRVYPGTPLWFQGLQEGLYEEDYFVRSGEEALNYEGGMSAKESYKESRKILLDFAKIKGLRGYIDLLKLGNDILRRAPAKILKGV